MAGEDAQKLSSLGGLIFAPLRFEPPIWPPIWVCLEHFFPIFHICKPHWLRLLQPSSPFSCHLVILIRKKGASFLEVPHVRESAKNNRKRAVNTRRKSDSEKGTLSSDQNSGHVGKCPKQWVPVFWNWIAGQGQLFSNRELTSSEKQSSQSDRWTLKDGTFTKHRQYRISRGAIKRLLPKKKMH